MKYKKISVVDNQGIVTLTLERPEVFNALDELSVQEIKEAVYRSAEKSDLRGLIITGRGEKAFSAGADLKSLSSLSAVEYYNSLEDALEVLEKIWTMKVPTVAAINGLALGGGCELALACDFRIAVPEARIGLPELNHALLPGWGGVHLMSRILGRAKTLELVLTGEPVKGDKALEIGLVTKIAPRERLLEEAEALIKKVGEKGPIAIKLVKEIVNNYQDTDIKKAFFHEALCSMAAFVSEDAREGIKAFSSNEKPFFKGK